MSSGALASTVSIHASTWEATAHRINQTIELVVSIHASTWEATFFAQYERKKAQVSIHASTWEATKTVTLTVTKTEFQSTPPRGRRRSLITKN